MNQLARSDVDQLARSKLLLTEAVTKEQLQHQHVPLG